MRNRVLLSTIALAALLVSTTAGAGAVQPGDDETQPATALSPQGTPIRPTLSEWGTLLLGLGLGWVGFAAARRSSAPARH
jgi:hypothetical protein